MPAWKLRSDGAYLRNLIWGPLNLQNRNLQVEVFRGDVWQQELAEKLCDVGSGKKESGEKVVFDTELLICYE